MNWDSLISDNPFYEFTLILALGALLGAIGQLLKQPLIVMFIVLGILVGPSVLDLVKSKDNFELLAKIGIAILSKRAVADDVADQVVEAIANSARTGKIGDGKIFVSELLEAIRIRTGETGAEAV